MKFPVCGVKILQTGNLYFAYSESVVRRRILRAGFYVEKITFRKESIAETHEIPYNNAV